MLVVKMDQNTDDEDENAVEVLVLLLDIDDETNEETMFEVTWMTMTNLFLILFLLTSLPLVQLH